MLGLFARRRDRNRSHWRQHRNRSYWSWRDWVLRDRTLSCGGLRDWVLRDWVLRDWILLHSARRFDHRKLGLCYRRLSRRTIDLQGGWRRDSRCNWNSGRNCVLLLIFACPTIQQFPSRLRFWMQTRRKHPANLMRARRAFKALAISRDLCGNISLTVGTPHPRTFRLDK